jgi:hypothetical protein
VCLYLGPSEDIPRCIQRAKERPLDAQTETDTRRDRHRQTQTDRDRQRQTDTQTDRETERQKDRQTDRQTDRHLFRLNTSAQQHTHIQTLYHITPHHITHTCSHVHTHTCALTRSHTHTHLHTHTHTHTHTQQIGGGVVRAPAAVLPYQGDPLPDRVRECPPINPAI